MDWLKALLGEELFAQVAPLLANRTLAIVEGEGADGSWIPKAKFDTVNTELGTIRTQLGERDTQLAELAEKAKGNDELSNTVAQMQQANEAREQEFAAALQKERLNAAIKLALVQANAHDPNTVMPLVKTEGLELQEDGTVKGLEEQLQTLGTEKAFLFATDKAGKALFIGKRSAELGGSPSGKKWTDMTLTEQSNLYKENPDLAAQLKAEAGS